MATFRPKIWGPGMTEPRPQARSDIEAELSKIDSLIATASRLVNDGRLVDLSALERRIVAACDAAVALPAYDSRPLLPVMKQIIVNLDDLTLHLSARFGDLPKLQGEAAPVTAASAYGQFQDKSD